MYDEIVVPIDVSPASFRAIDVATWLQRRTGARLVIVSAVSDPARRGETTWRIKEALSPSVASHCSVEVAHEHDAAALIAATAERSPASVVCMATRGHGRAVEAIAGSVAREVLAGATRPVVLVGPHVDPARREWDSVLACTDETAASAAMLPTAADWAAGLGLTLWIVNVRPPVTAVAPFATPVGAPAPLAPTFPESDLVRIARDLRRPGLDPSWEALHGDDPAEAIVRAAEDRPGALLALGTHNRHGVARIVLGSVAQRVVRDSPAPVLVVPGGPSRS